MTIEILITGLIAFVPQGPGQVDVLLPNTAVWNRDHPSYPVPEHRAFLGVLESQLADGTSCATLPGLESLTAAGQARGRTVCWIPLDRRELRLGTLVEGRPPDRIPTEFLGDFSQFGPTVVSEVRADLVDGGGVSSDLVLARARLGFEHWTSCGFAGVLKEGKVLADEWEFRHPFSSPGDGSALRALATSQRLELTHPGLEIEVLSLQDGQRVGVIPLRDGQDPVRILIQNSAANSHGPPPTSDPHFAIYYELSKQGAAVEVPARRIPHRHASTREIAAECEDTEFTLPCGEDDPLVELVEKLSTEAKGESLLEAFSQIPRAQQFLLLPKNDDRLIQAPAPETPTVGSLSPAAPEPERIESVESCRVGPPLCPQALFRAPTPP